MYLIRSVTAILLLIVSSTAIAQRLDTGEPPLKVDLNQRGLIEVELNLKEKPTLWISAVNGDDSVVADFTVEGETFTTSDLILQYAPCPGSRDDKAALRASNSAKAILPCVITVDKDATNPNRALITAPPRGMQISVTGNVGGNRVTRFVKVEMNYRYFDLAYSGGLMLSSQRDDHYTLRAETGGAQTAVLAGREDYKRALVALGTMNINGMPSLGFSFGVGTESAQLNELSILAGGTVTLRPRRLIDAVIFTLGAAYLPRQTLKPEFTTAGSIPADVELKDVLATRRSVKPFLSITFRTSGNAAAVRTPLGGTPSQ